MYTSFSFILYLYYIIFFFKSQIMRLLFAHVSISFLSWASSGFEMFAKRWTHDCFIITFIVTLFFIIIISYFFIKVKCPVKKSFFNIISYFLYKVKYELSGFNRMVSHMLVARINNLGLSTFPVFDSALPYPAGFQWHMGAYEGNTGA